MVRTALASLLNLEPDIEVVAQVSRGDEVVAAADASVPDVALLDIEMPGSTGLDAADDLRRALPDCRILILTTFGRPGYLRRAMASGAAGFLLKDTPAGELAAAIRRAVAGERVVDPGLAAAALSQGESPLTPREHEVLARVPRTRHRGRPRRRPLPLARNRPQPSVLGNAEARRSQPGGGRARGGGEGLAVAAGARRPLVHAGEWFEDDAGRLVSIIASVQ